METIVGLILYLIILVIVITVHEFSHAWTGHMLGDVTAKREGRLSLNPFVHIDPVFTLALPIVLILLHSPVVFGAAKPVPFNPYAVRYGKWGAALLAVAGPASNLIMAVFVGLYIRFFNIGDGLAYQFLVQFCVVNIAFFVFNMIPFPPLDGSRVLYAVVPPKVADVMESIERFGLGGILLFMFVLYPFIQPFFTGAVRGLTTLILGSSPF